ncbi:MAG: hypothetical protein LBQ32_02745 [Burkholderiaceae bacterium]|jgi:hypothetical protein|nr:hypothetical protein [Burkholderiaceae bacterium]
MTLDQKIQIGNAVGTWLAGIATFGAVVVSLYLARKSESVRLKTNVGIRLVFAGDGTPAEEHIGFTVVNLGECPITVASIGWRVGRGKEKRFCVQPVAGRYTDQYPKQLAHGEQATFLVSFRAAPNWASEFAKGFVQDTCKAHLSTLRGQIYTSVGRTIDVVPEGGLIEKLRSANAG